MMKPDFTDPRNAAAADQLAMSARDNTPKHIAHARDVLTNARSRAEALGTLTIYYIQKDHTVAAGIAADALLRLVEQGDAP